MFPNECGDTLCANSKSTVVLCCQAECSITKSTILLLLVLPAKNEIFYVAHGHFHICSPYVGSIFSSNPMQLYLKYAYLSDSLIDCGLFCTVNGLSETNGLSAHGWTLSGLKYSWIWRINGCFESPYFLKKTNSRNEKFKFDFINQNIFLGNLNILLCSVCHEHQMK